MKKIEWTEVDSEDDQMDYTTVDSDPHHRPVIGHRSKEERAKIATLRGYLFYLKTQCLLYLCT